MLTIQFYLIHDWYIFPFQVCTPYMNDSENKGNGYHIYIVMQGAHQNNFLL